MALYRLPFNNIKAFPPSWAGSGNWDSPTPDAHGWGQPFAWDITFAAWSPNDRSVYAARAGTVIEARDGIKGSNDSDGSGNFVLIRHADNTVFAYLHMWHDSIVVAVGDYVAQGDRIGIVGNSGATGGVVHLHMEGNTWHDPKVISDFTDDAFGTSMLVHFEDGSHTEPWRPVGGDVFVPNPLHRRQDGWRFCAKCAGLYFEYQGKNGVCPSGGKHQTQMHGGVYTLNLNAGDLPGEQGWKYCYKCRVLFFASQQPTSKCPLTTPDDRHDGGKSWEFRLVKNISTDPGQHSWRHCLVCQGLFYGNALASVCPAGQTIHIPTPGQDYSLHLSAKDIEQDWRICSKCKCLFRGGSSVCPSKADGTSQHDRTGSPNHSLCMNVSPINGSPPKQATVPPSSQGWEADWRHCRNCGMLWHSGSDASKAICINSSHGHSDVNSAPYWLFKTKTFSWKNGQLIYSTLPSTLGYFKCKICSGLFNSVVGKFIVNTASAPCPGASEHKPDYVSSYILPTDNPSW